MCARPVTITIPESVVSGYTPGVGLEISKKLRRGIRWLLRIELKSVDYDEMVRQLNFCEAENRLGNGCGCDDCPHLILCREMFDTRCPSTTLDEEVMLLNRPWCCGRPMILDGFQVQGSIKYRAYRCRQCGRRPRERIRI